MNKLNDKNTHKSIFFLVILNGKYVDNGRFLESSKEKFTIEMLSQE